MGKQKAWGLADSDGLVFLDSRLKGKKALEILLHECLHLLYVDDSEEEIIKKSVILTNTLWHEKYRKIEDDDTTPLQDGSL